MKCSFEEFYLCLKMQVGCVISDSVHIGARAALVPNSGRVLDCVQWRGQACSRQPLLQAAIQPPVFRSRGIIFSTTLGL